MSGRGTQKLPQDAQYAALSPSFDRLYVACSNGGIGRRGDEHSLCVFRVGTRGDLQMEGAIALPHRPIHVAVDPESGRLHIAFNRPAAYMAVRLDDRGSTEEVVHYSEDADLLGGFPHQVLAVPGTADVVLTCRGEDPAAGAAEGPGSIRILRPDRGNMACIQTIAPGSGIGFAPRNCAFHPSLPVLYAVLERQNAFAVFERSGAGWAAGPSAMLSTLLPDRAATAAQLAGDLCIHPNGRTAYVLNRANLSMDPTGENSIAMFELAEETGIPRYETSIRLSGQRPRTVAITSRGDLLAVTEMGRRATEPAKVSLFSIGPGGFPRQEAHIAVGANTPLLWAAFQGAA